MYDEKYFKILYKPARNRWSNEDLIRHKNWYFSWIRYIGKFLDIENGFGKQVFEVGSGIGAMVSILSERGFKCIGSDISNYIIEKAIGLNPDINFIWCDIQQGINTNENYDYILAFEVLEHLYDPNKAIVNIYKKLNQAGIFIGSTPYPFSKNMLDPTHVDIKYPVEWMKLFKDVGFKEVLTKPMSFIPFIYRLNKKFNPVIPLYLSMPKFVSTILIIAKK